MIFHVLLLGAIVMSILSKMCIYLENLEMIACFSPCYRYVIID